MPPKKCVPVVDPVTGEVKVRLGAPKKPAKRMPPKANGSGPSSKRLKQDAAVETEEQKLEKIEAALLKKSKEIQDMYNIELDLDELGEENGRLDQIQKAEKDYAKYAKQIFKQMNWKWHMNRAVEKKFKLTGVTDFPALNEKMEQFVNNLPDMLTIPLLEDILKVVEDANEAAEEKYTTDAAELKQWAVSFLKKITFIMRERRIKDLSWSALDISPPDDPDLMAKLEKSDLDKVSLENFQPREVEDAADETEENEAVEDDDSEDEEDSNISSDEDTEESETVTRETLEDDQSEDDENDEAANGENSDGEAENDEISDDASMKNGDKSKGDYAASDENGSVDDEPVIIASVNGNSDGGDRRVTRRQIHKATKHDEVSNDSDCQIID